jgi:hypothetical protein
MLDLYIFRAPGRFVQRTDTGWWSKARRWLHEFSASRTRCLKAQRALGRFAVKKKRSRMTGYGSLRNQISLLAVEGHSVTQTERAFHGLGETVVQ